MSKYIGAHENEIFIGNVPDQHEIQEHLVSLKTVRFGEKAMDIDGYPLPGYRPMFINRSEADSYHRIMMKLTFPKQHVW